jgi:hypothetical protein
MKRPRLSDVMQAFGKTLESGATPHRIPDFAGIQNATQQANPELVYITHCEENQRTGYPGVLIRYAFQVPNTNRDLQVDVLPELLDWVASEPGFSKIDKVLASIWSKPGTVYFAAIQKIIKLEELNQDCAAVQKIVQLEDLKRGCCLVKIGRSSQLQARMQKLPFDQRETVNKFLLSSRPELLSIKLKKIIRLKDMQLGELFYHRKFHQNRLVGEWFAFASDWLENPEVPPLPDYLRTE